MKNIIYARNIIFILLIFLSCKSSAQNSWEKLEYYYNVGSLPPPYHYSYTITIDKDGKGNLKYMGGYESTDKNTSEYAFELNAGELKKLKKEIKKSDILNLDIKQRPNEEIPDGGHSDGLQIFGKDDDGKFISIKSIPSYPDLKYEKTLDKLYDTIKKSVPENIWKEVDSKKSK
ncbi:MAG: hypothetical protein HY959_05400 [Ignavibacteriae bacterium]|nr:hypothetical protein [Ignavibacteriota bacterium]